MNKQKLKSRYLDKVIEVYGSIPNFISDLDEEHSDYFDVFLSHLGRNYIIERKTGLFVNWDVFESLTRNFHTNIPMRKMKSFLKRYKGGK